MNANNQSGGAVIRVPMGSGWLKPWQVYVFAIAVTVATLLLRLALDGPLEGRPTLIIFMLPIMLSAYVGGLRAGLLATGLTCYLVCYYVLPPFQSFHVASESQRWDLFFVGLAGVVVSALNEALHRARRQANLATSKQLARVAEVKATALQNAIFNSANFSSIATDEKGVIQIFNVGAERMLGYAATDVMNKITPAEISDPQEVIARAQALTLELGTPIAPGFEALVFKASRGIEDVYELTYIRKDGSRFPAVVSVTALRDAHGGVIGYLLIGTDNTARKRAEEALLKAGALQNAIFNSAYFSCMATDEKGVIQLFNVGAERMLGYAAAEVLNKITPADLHDPQEVIARAQALSRELRTTIAPGFEALAFKASRGIEDIYELTKIRKDGSRFPAVVSVTALRDNKEGIIGYLLIGTDNTARRQVDARLRESNERIAIATESAGIGVWEYDLASNTSIWDGRMYEIYGLPRMQGTEHYEGWVACLHPDDRETCLGEFASATRGEKKFDTEFRIIRPDGKIRYVKAAARTLRSPDGSVIRLIGVNFDITERELAEEAAAHLAAIVNSSSDAIIGKDLNSIVTSWNAGAEKVFGYLASEMVGTSIMRLIPADRQDEEAKIIQRIMTGESFEHYETFRMAKDGHLVDISVTVSPVREKSGKIVGASKVAHDISERKKAEAARRESEARYRTLFDYAPDGIVIADSQSYYLDANASICRMLGYTRDELIGKHASDIVAPAEIPFIGSALAIIKADAGYQREWLFRRKDGSQFVAEVIATAMPDGNLMGMVRDMTERKRVDEQLRESNERIAIATESAGIGVWEYDVASGSSIWDNRMYQIYGVPRAEGAEPYAAWAATVHPDDREKCTSEIASALRGEKKFESEFRIVRPDGEIRHLKAAARTLLSSDGKVIRLTGVNFDMTERKRVEEQLQKTNVELEITKSAAEKANLAKSEFLSSMSHELRSPLNAILGFAQLMESAAPAPARSQTKSIAQILQAGWYLLKLINEILDLSGIESGQISLSMEMVSLSDLMAECQAMMEPQAQKRHVEMTFPHFVTPVYVNADLTRMKQIVVNLLSNAIKYNKDGGSVVVDCSVYSANRVRISVRDTGEGLPPEKVAQLFQPFNRLGQEAGGVTGTGIGLVVTKRLVELMDGVLGVESTVGVGSVFWCEMGMAEEHQLFLENGNNKTSVQVEATGENQLRTVLYVEDNPANMSLIEELIARHPDLRLLTAVNASLGIELARATHPHAILMDINLPGLSGIKALNILREDPATAQIPVIALSANAMPRDIAKGLEAGFFSYLTKPIKVKEFMDMLNAALEFAGKTDAMACAARQRP